MNYIDRIAERIYWHNDPAADDISDDDMVLYRMYAVLALAKGELTTLMDVHDAWSAWTAGLRPSHRSLVPFGELEPRVQELDRPYVEAIHQVAQEILREQYA